MELYSGMDTGAEGTVIKYAILFMAILLSLAIAIEYIYQNKQKETAGPIILSRE